MTANPRIVFFGTTDFAVTSLEALLTSRFEIVAVVTAPDKPAGRGLHLVASPVKQFALLHHLAVLQPGNLKDEQFFRSLSSLKPDLQVVVAFRMLPQRVWDLPLYGTINLHASLLPQYRGAAPINWALINGETMTGVTTFFINEQIDTGNILFQQKVAIGEDETAGELTARLKVTGAQLVVQTVSAIGSECIKPLPQNQIITPDHPLRSAPKLNKEDMVIDWYEPIEKVYNRIRAFAPYPGASAVLRLQDGESLAVKIMEARMGLFPNRDVAVVPGEVTTDRKRVLHIAANGGYIDVHTIQPAGKKAMKVIDFLNGFGSRLV